MLDRFDQAAARIRRALARRLHAVIERVVAPACDRRASRRPGSPAHDVRPGDRVRVRSLAEIDATLGADGKCRGLPFMEPMARFCGQELRVLKRVERMYDERTRTMRKLRDVVLLDGAVCDGTGTFAEETCDRCCFFFFKTDWIERVGS